LRLVVIKERKPFEKRVALTPEICSQLIKNGYEVTVESDAGMASFFSDQLYIDVGAKVESNKEILLSTADVALKVNPFEEDELQHLKNGSATISFMYALSSPELVKSCSDKGISAFSVDAIPRISRAQKMDALSSQANLAGFKAVIIGAYHLPKIFPLLMTAAGTIKPARVVIMGAGVAGLQAIATAKRLGAIVEVSDIRPETKEQVESLGGKFIEIPQDTSVKIEGGYVTAVSDEFLKKQKEIIAKHIAMADLIITTALIPGKKAPMLVTEEAVASMKPGSVIVDMAVEQGGNCACSEYGKVVSKHGVTIVGEPNIPSLLPLNASDLYAKNIATFLTHLAAKDGFKWEMDEEITKGSLITHQGKIVYPPLLK
jgi:H+-translocating NAD(P) transhydrogenase subunit alpha